MKIAVVSPNPHVGATTATLLISYALSRTQAMSTLLTYSGINQSISHYVGRQGQEDRTRSISQVCKLLEAHAIAPSGLSEYCTKYGPNLELLDSASDAITEEERAKLLTFVFEQAPHDVVFCDVSADLYDETSQKVLQACDMIITVANPYNHTLDLVREWRTSEYWPDDKDVMLLVNRYDEGIAAVSECAARAGFKTRNTCKLHYNPWISKLCNKEELDTIVPYIMAKDPRVIELNKDLQECVQFITSNMGLSKYKWED